MIEKEANESDSVGCRQVVLTCAGCQEEDEINLVDLWNILWQSKKIIIGVFFACLFVAIGFAFFLPRVYRAEVDLLPPGVEDIVDLNVSDQYKVDPQTIYAEFEKNLQRKGLRHKFFIENNLGRYFASAEKVDPYLLFEQYFDRNVAIKEQGKQGGNLSGFLHVSLDGTQAKHLADWLQNLVSFIDRYTVQSKATGIAANIKVQAKLLEDKIATLRLVAARKRQDRIKLLQKSVKIARQLDIKNPMTSLFVRETGSQGSSATDNILTDSQAVPLYFRGYVALESELNNLEQRKDDDAFIRGLRIMQGELAALENIKIDVSSAHSVRVDQPARLLDNPINPKRKLIIALGGLLGLMLGVFSVFIRNMLFRNS